MSSRAVAVAEEIKTQLATILGQAATVRRLWVPVFAVKDITAKPVVAVRPAGRGTTKAAKAGAVNTVQIEIGILRKIPGPDTASDDPNNNMEELDAVDALAEKVFDLFVLVDDDEDPNRGKLATTRVAGHLLVNTEQPTAVDQQNLRERREFVTVIILTYQLEEY